MRQRRVAIVLIALLCASALLSGALLILHPEHECRHETCVVCMAMGQRAEVFLGLLTAFGTGSVLYVICTSTQPVEDRAIPVWTPVRRKVKLLN